MDAFNTLGAIDLYDYDANWPILNKDNQIKSFSDAIKSKTKKIIDDDFVYTYARNYEYLWDNPSLITTTTTDIKTKRKTGRYYSCSLTNVEAHLVHSIIGNRGIIHKELSRKYNLKYFHIGKPILTVLKNDIKKNYCKIVLRSYNRDELMAAIREIIQILRDEEQLYIEVDFSNTN